VAQAFSPAAQGATGCGWSWASISDLCLFVLVSRLYPAQEVTTTLTIKMRVHPQVNVNHLLAEAHVILCDREAQKQSDRGAQQQEVEVPVRPECL